MVARFTQLVRRIVITTATSLILIALGAILAFAVSYDVAGISIQTVGIILIIVGGIGLGFALLTIAGYAPFDAARRTTAQPPANVAPPSNSTPPSV